MYETEPIEQKTLEQLSEIAQRQQHWEDEVDRLDGELATAKGILRSIAEGELPALMDEIGMEKFTTINGLTIDVGEQIRAKIPEARNAEAIRWLEGNGHGGLVKRLFTIEFDRNELDWAKAFEHDARNREKPLRLKKKESVHSSTLRAFVAEQLREGEAIPLDLFGVFRQRIAKIKKKE